MALSCLSPCLLSPCLVSSRFLCLLWSPSPTMSPATDLDLFFTAGTSLGLAWKQDLDLLMPDLMMSCWL